MIVRMFILLALLLGTLPAPAAAVPACHDAPEMAMAMAGSMAIQMNHGTPPTSEREQVPAMGKMLCVGCIAPSTMNTASLDAPQAPVAAHGSSISARAMTGALLTPEPPPPRG